MTINTIFFKDLYPNTNSTYPEDEIGDACIPNISPIERQKRLNFGVRQLIRTLVILAVMIALGLNHFWRLPLLFMFWAAGTGFFQAFDKT